MKRELIAVLALVTLTMVNLKYIGVIGLPWWAVLLPLAASFTALFVTLAFMLMVHKKPYWWRDRSGE